MPLLPAQQIIFLQRCYIHCITCITCKVRLHYLHMICLRDEGSRQPASDMEHRAAIVSVNPAERPRQSRLVSSRFVEAPSHAD